MKKIILVTGSSGFIGRNLCLALRRTGSHEVLEFDLQQSADELPELCARADFVFHLAGVNRPKDEKEFAEGNTDFTGQLCKTLASAGRRAPVVLSSSIQAELDNPYGRSKKAAEEIVINYGAMSGVPVYVFRFPNVFGKWSRPNYNTVVATFCHNISRGMPVQVSNRANPLRFVYIDDIVGVFMDLAARTRHEPYSARREFEPVYSITLGELHDLLLSFRDIRDKALLPDLANPLTKYLHSTYMSFLDTNDFAYPVSLKTDERGWLFELVKSPGAGQVFVSRTKPGITRGNHYHDTKTEKFCVVQGEGVVRFRHVLGADILEYPVNDRDIRIVDIPAGYTHSIENTGRTDLITLFWSNEIFDALRPDTYSDKVLDNVGEAAKA